MADSIPKLRRLLNEAQDRIRELEAVEPEVIERVVEVEVEKIVEVEVDNPVPFEIEVAMYPPEIHVVNTETVSYHESPELIETIRRLQAKVAELSGVSQEEVE